MTEQQPLPKGTIEQYQNVFDDLKFTAVGRDELLDLLQLNFLVRGHTLAWGETGEGKTWLTGEVFSRFPDPNRRSNHVFPIQFTRDMPPEALLGGHNIRALQQGRVEYNVEKSIVTARFIFGDEIFDGPDFILRTMLGALADERTVRLGQQLFENIPLHSLIATSNFRRDTRATAALLNRMTGQYHVPTEPNLIHRASLSAFDVARAGYTPERAILPYTELYKLSQIALGENKDVSIVLPWSVIYLKDLIVDRFVEIVQQHQAELTTEQRKIMAPLQQEALGVNLVSTEIESAAAQLPKIWKMLGADRFISLVLNSVNRLMQQLREKSNGSEQEDRFRISSSRGMQLNHLLRASAMLDRRTTVLPTDLNITRFGLYPVAEEPTVLDACFKEAVQQALGKTDSKEVKQAEEALAAIILADLLVGKSGQAAIPSRMAREATISGNDFVNLHILKAWLESMTPESVNALKLRDAALAKVEKGLQIAEPDQNTVQITNDPRILVYDDVVR